MDRTDTINYLRMLSLPSEDMICPPSKELPENHAQLVSDGSVMDLQNDWEVGPGIINAYGNVINVLRIGDSAINLNGRDTIELCQYLISELIKDAQTYDKKGTYDAYIKLMILNALNATKNK